MAKESAEEFRIMITNAIDREELETVRLMLLESSDLTFNEREQLGAIIDARYKETPETRNRAEEKVRDDP